MAHPQQTTGDERYPSNSPSRTEASVSNTRETLSWLGFGSLILGIFLIILPTIGTIAIELIFGAVFTAAGVINIGYSFGRSRWSGSALSLSLGVLYLLGGLLLLFNPMQGAIALTTFVGLLFLVEGSVTLFSLGRISALGGSKGWAAASGVASLLLGGLILAGLPGTGLWMLGLLAGVNFVMTGIAFLSLKQQVASA